MAADGTGDRLADSLPGTVYDGLYAWSNDSKRIIVDRGYARTDDRTYRGGADRRDRASVELVCPTIGVGSCGDGWSWSPNDDSLLAGLDLDGPSARYVLADPVTGRVTELPWSASGQGSWQRVGP